MSKCLVAQSGGPSSVMNATVAGIVKANQLNPVYDAVLGGINGVEGILQEKFVDLTNMSEEENRILRQTPSSALGSCRYKLRQTLDQDDYEIFFYILEKYDIETVFYIGGVDSMDTIQSLVEYAELNRIHNHRFIGCPKTIDNDLVLIDHTPGFGSAAKYIASTAMECWMDLNSYTRQEVFILETMGRDAGWLASSAMLSGIVDMLILPEVDFEEEMFIAGVKKHLEEKNKCFIVVSEGAHYQDGTYLSSSNLSLDGFGHVTLGGASDALKTILLKNKVATRIRVQNLGTAQRCNISAQSLVDVEESYHLGVAAHLRSTDIDFSGKMIGLVRKSNSPYQVEYTAFDCRKIINRIKNVPNEWILENYSGVTEDALEYLKPLIEGEVDTVYHNGIPSVVKPYYL